MVPTTLALSSSSSVSPLGPLAVVHPLFCSIERRHRRVLRKLRKYNTLTWRNCNDPTKFCPPKDFFLTMEPWKNRSLSMLKFRGRSADIKPYVLRMNLATLCNNTKTWQTNTTLRFSISSSKIETIDWFYGMKLATQSTKQCRCGLSTSFGSRFGWKANTVRSRVFCSMTNHTWLLGCGFHGGMDSNQVGRWWEALCRRTSSTVCPSAFAWLPNIAKCMMWFCIATRAQDPHCKFHYHLHHQRISIFLCPR